MPRDLLSAARDILERIEEVAEPQANAQAEAEGEDSYWVAGNITRSSVEELRSAIEDAVRQSHGQP